MNPELKKELEKFAARIRIGTVECIGSRGFGHIGGSLSVCDALAVLYGAVMRVDPENPLDPDRDKLVCSKGHAGPAVYSVLALKGYIPYEKLKTLNRPGTDLPSHCDRKKTVGVDMTTGSLGQGTSLAAGMALGDRIAGRKCRTYLITGDGETDGPRAMPSIPMVRQRIQDAATLPRPCVVLAIEEMTSSPSAYTMPAMSI